MVKKAKSKAQLKAEADAKAAEENGESNGAVNGETNGQTDGDAGATNGTNPDAKIAAMIKRFTTKREEIPVDKYFRALVQLEGSDLHMKAGKPPIVRIHGTLKSLNRGPIEVEEMANLLFPLMNERTRKIFDEEGG